MAIVTGVLVRVYRLTMLTYAPLDRPWALLAAIAGGVVILLGLATIHLGNYPVRHWLWRAPAFAVVESLAAMGVSAALIAAGVEHMGTAPMHWHDWRADLWTTIKIHFLLVVAFALVLAGVVQLVRRALLKHEHREHTLEAIHEEHVRQTH
jgi:Na+-translocating ferredoxin:NAD+ oxidoreductase RnfA subunit